MLGKRGPESALRITKLPQGTNRQPGNSIFGTLLQKLGIGACESVLLLQWVAIGPGTALYGFQLRTPAAVYPRFLLDNRGNKLSLPLRWQMRDYYWYCARFYFRCCRWNTAPSIKDLDLISTFWMKVFWWYVDQGNLEKKVNAPPDMHVTREESMTNATHITHGLFDYERTSWHIPFLPA